MKYISVLTSHPATSAPPSRRNSCIRACLCILPLNIKNNKTFYSLNNCFQLWKDLHHKWLNSPLKPFGSTQIYIRYTEGCKTHIRRGLKQLQKDARAARVGELKRKQEQFYKKQKVFLTFATISIISSFSSKYLAGFKKIL